MKKMNILIVGGVGDIGSHMNKEFTKKDFAVIEKKRRTGDTDKTITMLNWQSKYNQLEQIYKVLGIGTSN